MDNAVVLDLNAGSTRITVSREVCPGKHRLEPVTGASLDWCKCDVCDSDIPSTRMDSVAGLEPEIIL